QPQHTAGETETASPILKFADEADETIQVTLGGFQFVGVANRRGQHPGHGFSQVFALAPTGVEIYFVTGAQADFHGWPLSKFYVRNFDDVAVGDAGRRIWTARLWM